MGKEKPKRKPPKRRGRVFNTSFPNDVYEALERYCQAQRVPPQRTDVIVLSVTEFLGREGYWPPEGGDGEDEGD